MNAIARRTCALLACLPCCMPACADMESVHCAALRAKRRHPPSWPPPWWRCSRRCRARASSTAPPPACPRLATWCVLMSYLSLLYFTNNRPICSGVHEPHGLLGSGHRLSRRRGLHEQHEVARTGCVSVCSECFFAVLIEALSACAPARLPGDAGACAAARLPAAHAC